jgi:hypothetical protein
MTYRESYMQFENLEDLLEEVKHDMVIAQMINPDRVGIVRESAEEVINLKFKDKSEVADSE